MVSTEFVTKIKILEMCPSLLLQVNAKTEEEEIDLEIGLKSEWETLQMTNYENNTALHEAVRHKRFHVVKILTEKGDPDFHNLGETPLYLAAARGYKDDSMVIQILERCTSAAHEGPNGKTALHAAAIACSSSDTSTAYIGDKDRRMTPLHMAAGRGNLKAMKTIISNCPECYELEDNRGWNVLHFAVLGLDEEDLKHLLRESSLIRSLINKKDAKGNTPFHILAATHPNYYIDYSWGDMEAVNNQNFSVLDIIIYGYSELEKEIQELSKDVGKGNQYPKGVIRLRKGTKIEDRQKEYLSAEDEKETRASHLVVATLIATVTFAAAFTFPGGYNSEKGPNQGTAILYRNPAFQAFIITDTIAMTLSLSAVFIHLFLSTKKIQKSEDLSIQLLGIALILTMFSMGAMVIAFIAGTYAVLEPSSGLAVTTCFIGFIFFLLVFCVLRLILKSE
ncbi:hypothetical protein Patl1_28038 [Pistacia atlantica]|uniref:Uncharacterized protein n=1 Tax=Pistacia atlantica TaxID=434234 RepID=A0ACC1BBW0_9ROSI|nr:hypothetical protein Patl1_28038 [Pistacia atlantica]